MEKTPTVGPRKAIKARSGSEFYLRKDFAMLVIGRKAADSLREANASDQFSSFRITVPASTVPRVIQVTLCELRPGNQSARIGIDAERDVIVERTELIRNV